MGRLGYLIAFSGRALAASVPTTESPLIAYGFTRLLAQARRFRWDVADRGVRRIGTGRDRAGGGAGGGGGDAGRGEPGGRGGASGGGWGCCRPWRAVSAGRATQVGMTPCGVAFGSGRVYIGAEDMVREVSPGSD